MQKLLILFNPFSSAGNSHQVALHLKEELNQSLPKASIEVAETTPNWQSYLDGELTSNIRAAELLIAVGGDGTVRDLLPVLSETQTPLYMVPRGNESLFAQFHKMTGTAENILSAIKALNIVDNYFGLVSSSPREITEPFFSMASMGLDSMTVSNIGIRKGRLNDTAYAVAGGKAFLNYTLPTLSIAVDGKTFIENEQGYLIIANSPTYARGLNLVPDANPRSPTLHVGFHKDCSRLVELRKLWHMLRRQPITLPSMKYGEGTQITIKIVNKAYPIQLDGDLFPGNTDSGETTIEVISSGKTLRTLSPRDSWS